MHKEGRQGHEPSPEKATSPFRQKYADIIAAVDRTLNKPKVKSGLLKSVVFLSAAIAAEGSDYFIGRHIPSPAETAAIRRMCGDNPVFLNGGALFKPETETAPLKVEGKMEYKRTGLKGNEIWKAELAEHEVRRILDTLPKGWVGDQIAAITFSNKPEPQPEPNPELHLKKGTITLAEIDGGYGSRKATLKFYKAAKDAVGEFAFADLYHESAHANDWERNNLLSPEERATLLLKVLQRVRAENRYRSEYVEAINNPDKQKELYFKATEYWAEICSQYFTDPQALSLEDFAIVNGLVLRNDPSYDAFGAARERKSAIRAETIETRQ